MSGCTMNTTCPNCGNDEATLYSDYKPYDRSDVTCQNCGFYTTTTIGYMTLEEINYEREQVGLKPLKKLPKQREIE